MRHDDSLPSLAEEILAIDQRLQEIRDLLPQDEEGYDCVLRYELSFTMGTYWREVVTAAQNVLKEE